MVKDYETLMGMDRVVMEQSYTGRDSCLYALGVGCGMDVSDDWMRQYLSPLPPARSLTSMASVLAAPRVHAMNLGLTMSGVLHGSQSLKSHHALPAEGRVRSETRIAEIFNRGDGRGSQIAIVRELKDAQSGLHYASLVMTLICRSDHVEGAPDQTKPSTREEERGEPDELIAVPSSTQAAQIFSLLGDQNPLHLLPEAAAKSGFPMPILHGLATYGLCAAFAEKALCAERGGPTSRRLVGISGRFNAPVFPGEMVEIAVWRKPDGAQIEARIPAREKVVFADGQVTVGKDD